jgi:acetyl coenzyme A synthetase (ADP forming)-like protein
MRVMSPPRTPLADQPLDRIVLRDGSAAMVRVTEPADHDAMHGFFQELSPASRYNRFFTPAPPSEALIDRFCDSTDPKRAVTLVAVRTLEHQPRFAGVASYSRIDDSTAEVAFAIDDHFHGKGIATSLLERLAALAAGAGFTRFQATTLSDNHAMLEVFRDSGFAIRSKLAGGAIDVSLTLAPSAATVASIESRERLATAASIRPFLQPRAVAVIGASRDPASLGRRIFDAIRHTGYSGTVYPVNRAAHTLDGVATYRSIHDVPHGVDLAIVAVPREAMQGVVDECASAGVKALVLITAGFAETGPAGIAQQQQLVDTIRRHGMRMIGPNCMGLLNTDPALRLNATFSPVFPPAGRVALSSQSGALGIALLALASERHVGLSAFVSVGNKADVSSNDLLQYWEEDPATSVILLYLESFGNPRRFGRLARRIGRTKPIVVVKAGRTDAGCRAARSHTAALAANDVVIDALFHQAGIIRAETIDEMFDVAACLDAQPLPSGTRLAIVTNSGGPGILAADACQAAGVEVAELSAATRQQLAAFLPPVASLGNPIDLVASAGPNDYRQAIEVAMTALETDAILIIYTPVDPSQSEQILAAIRAGIASGRRAGGTNKPVLAAVMGGAGQPLILEAGGERIPTYRFPEYAVKALGKVREYANWRDERPGLLWDFDDMHVDDARMLCRDILQRRGDTWLGADEIQRVLGAFGLPLVPSTVARSATDAAALASVVGFPVAAKLSTTQLLHKSDIGAVRLTLVDEPAVRAAFDELMAIAQGQGLAGTVDGVLIQPMIAGGVETMIGVVHDPLFGPLIAFGLGGIHAELLGDVHFKMAPLTDNDADDLLHQIRGRRVLDGYRGHPAADQNALKDLLLRMSTLAEQLPEIAELDLNPVIALPPGTGCRIVDARIRLARPSAAPRKKSEA